MKYKLFFICLLITLCIRGISQEFRGGLIGGLNAARIDGDGHELWGKLGLNAGAFISREVVPGTIFWQLELKYSARGKYQGPTLSSPGIEIIDLKYAELPFSIHYLFNEKIDVELGLSPDVLLREYYADENGEISPDYAQDLRRFGITGLGGISYFVLPKLALGMRFNYSLIPFYKFDAYAVRYRDSGFFHDVLSLNARYYLSRN